jgi:acetyl-CoA carboxylase alpha subunit
MAGEAELKLRERLSKLKGMQLLGGAKLSGDLGRLERQLDRLGAEVTDEEIWRSVELARHQERPYTLDYIDRLLEDWVELHGDRARADDASIVTGLGRFNGRTIAVIGHQKGRDIGERTKRNFGMAYPEGYRGSASRSSRWWIRPAPTRASRPSSTARAARSRAPRRRWCGWACRRSPASSARAAPAARSRLPSPTGC